MRDRAGLVTGWFAAIALALAGALVAVDAVAQWQPQKNVEFVAMSGPGGANDVIARTLQQFIQQHKLVGVPVTVTNRPGGGGVIAWQYLNQHSGDGGYLSVSPINLLTEHIAGVSPITYTDVTPIAQLFNEYVAFAVHPDSPIRSGGDLAQRLRSEPGAASFAVAAALGGANHIATALAMKAAGAEVRRLKFVVFTSGAQSLTSVMGRHVDVAVVPVSGAAPQLQAGRVRILAVSSAQRLTGAFSAVPTWKEQGIDVVFSSFRGVIGPKGMTPEQIAYWEDVLGKLVRTEEWQQEMRKRYWESNFMASAETVRFLRAQYRQYRAVMADLGLAK